MMDQRSPACIPLFDAYDPPQIAQRVREVGVAKATAPIQTTFALALLGGAFISLGSLFYTVTITGTSPGALSFGLARAAGGIAFSLGLVLVVVGGAELFTGNNLLAMAWAARRITLRQVLRNWLVVYAGNCAGALGTVGLVFLAGVHGLADGVVGEVAVNIARSKGSVGIVEAVARGILCNVLVCLAVWLCLSARSVADKILGIVFPISAFVACGFEHSVANMYFLPMGFLLAFGTNDPLDVGGILSNLLWVTVGNIVGGTLLVAQVYWFVYLRRETNTAVDAGGHTQDVA